MSPRAARATIPARHRDPPRGAGREEVLEFRVGRAGRGGRRKCGGSDGDEVDRLHRQVLRDGGHEADRQRLRRLAAGRLQQELADHLRVRRKRVRPGRVRAKVHGRDRSRRLMPHPGAGEGVVAQLRRPVPRQRQLVVFLAGLVVAGGQRGGAALARGARGGEQRGEEQRTHHVLILSRPALP